MNNHTRKQLETQIYNKKINQHRPSFSSFFYKPVYNYLVSLDYHPRLRRLGNKYLTNKSVFAIGAGNNDVKFLIQFTSNITANNIAQAELDTITDKYHHIKTILSDAEDLSNIKTKYDVVFCRSILHHLHPTSKILKQIHRILKPNGILFIYSEPGYYHPFAFLGRRLTPSDTHTPGEKAFKFNTFESQVQCYFHPLSIDYFFFFSIMLAIIPSKLSFTASLCRFFIKPTVYLERKISQIPIFKNIFWITSAVYQRR